MSFSRQRRNASLIYNGIFPLLSEESADSKNVDSAFYGYIDTKLPFSELERLVECLKRDDVEEFKTFSYEEIEDIRLNVSLLQLPVSDFMMITTIISYN